MHHIVSLAITSNLTCRRKYFTTHVYDQSNPHYPQHKRIVCKWLWTIWNQTNKILPQLTTQRTKENEENSPLSLTAQQKVWREIPGLISNEKVTYIEFLRWPLGYIWPLAFHISRWLLAFHFPKVTLGISLLF